MNTDCLSNTDCGTDAMLIDHAVGEFRDDRTSIYHYNEASQGLFNDEELTSWMFGQSLV